MSRAFTSKPCPGCGLTFNLAPNTVCRECQEAIRDHKRLKAASEALGGSRFYALDRAIHPLQAGGLPSCVDFEQAFMDLLGALCASKPAGEAGFETVLATDYSGYSRGAALQEPRTFLATGNHSTSTAALPGLRGAIHRLFVAVDHLILQAQAQGQIEGQDLLGQLNAGKLSMAGLDQKTRDAERTRATAIDRRVQEEVQVANDLIAQTGCTRDEALRVAARVVGQDPQFR